MRRRGPLRSRRAHFAVVVAIAVGLFLPAGAHALTAVQVDVGSDSSCAVLVDGGVVCWGVGANGQLGNGGTASSATPVAVTGLDDATQVSVGYRTACAVREGGGVVCWGFNGYGQLGNGTLTDSTVPVAVSGLTDAVQVSAGTLTTCAVRSSGRVACWGSGAFGQRGDGTGVNASTPVNAITSAQDTHLNWTGDQRATRVEVGYEHTCAQLVGGAQACWGRNQFVQTGVTGNSGWDTARQVPTISTGRAITAGHQHTCAVLADGGARCWGGGGDGQLGRGSTANATSGPVAVSGISTATAISAGSTFSTCALLSAGTVHCWGGNYYGNLGIGTSGSGSGRTSPTQALNLADVTQIDIGPHHGCAMIADGSVRCWGWGYEGRVGNGSAVDVAVSTPVTVQGFEDPTPPDTVILAGPAGVTSRTTGVFRFGANEDDVTFACALDGADFAACATPLTLQGLADGDHVLRVRAIDAAGNVDPTPVSRSWTVRAGAASDGAAGTVPAGGTLVLAESTADVQPGGIAASVTSPIAGPVEIASSAITAIAPVGVTFLGVELVISAPAATAADPLVIVLRVDAGAVPAGVDPLAVDAFRNGVAVPACDDAGATPDPCLASRTLTGGDLVLTVRTSRASTWNLGIGSATAADVPGQSGGAPMATRARPSVRILAAWTTRQAIVLRLRVSGAGRIAVTGATAGADARTSACRGTVRARRAGVVFVRCTLTPTARRGREVAASTVRVRVRFVSPSGAAPIVTRVVAVPRFGRAEPTTG